MDPWNRNQNPKSFQDNKSSTWKGEWSREKQYDNRRERTGIYSQRDNSQNDRFIKDKTINNRFDRDKSYNKHDESDLNVSNRSNRGISRDGNRFTGKESERRYNLNNSFDKANSDKDSDTSSRSNDKRGKGGFKRNGFNDNRGASRDGGTPGRSQATNWNDKKPAMAYRNNYRNEQSKGTKYLYFSFNIYKHMLYLICKCLILYILFNIVDYGDNSNKFRNKEDNTNNVLYNQVRKNEL